MPTRTDVPTDPNADRRPFLAILGATGVGKSALALALAERLGAEIVSADSRQLYRGMDVGTAAPSVAEQARVRHHFVSERDPSEPLAAGAFARAAEARIDDILARGAVPLVVGGSALYADALVDGIADVPPVPDDVQAVVHTAAATPDGRAALYAELAAADPAAAATLDATKSHRLVRLVSVLRSSGPPSAHWAAAPAPRHAFQRIVLDRPRAELYARIDARVEQMVRDGLVDETQRLLAQGFDPERLPLRTIGYREAAALLRGELSEPEMVARIQQNTRRFAKRQLTWFRRYADAWWVPASEAPDDVLARWTANRA